ncbi:VWA domain-containing protein [candidate division KSB1 bacterium]|nr:VWA domain-containing protein [candidate division KSB1 bacterium]
MRKFLLPRTLFCLFFLIGILPATSCRFSNEPTPPADNTKVTEVAKTQEVRGLKITFEEGATQLPSKVSVHFRARTDYGKPVTRLQCSDLTLYEDDEPISSYESFYGIKDNPETARLSALLLLDLSGSIVKTSLDTLKRAAAAFVDTLFRSNYGNVELGISIFDGREKIVPLAEFTTDRRKLHDAAQKINPGLSLDNSTNLNGAVIEGVQAVNARLKSNKAIGLVPAGSLVIFTDGKDRAARVEYSKALKSVLESGLNVYAIGLKGEIDEGVLGQFGKDGFFPVDFIQNLVDKFKEVASFISDDANSSYKLEYCSPRRKGQHQLKIKVTNKDDYTSFGSITVAFSADGFSGGCQIDSSYRCEKDQ